MRLASQSRVVLGHRVAVLCLIAHLVVVLVTPSLAYNPKNLAAIQTPRKVDTPAKDIVIEESKKDIEFGEYKKPLEGVLKQGGDGGGYGAGPKEVQAVNEEGDKDYENFEEEIVPKKNVIKKPVYSGYGGKRPESKPYDLKDDDIEETKDLGYGKEKGYGGEKDIIPEKPKEIEYGKEKGYGEDKEIIPDGPKENGYGKEKGYGEPKEKGYGKPKEIGGYGQPKLDNDDNFDEPKEEPKEEYGSPKGGYGAPKGGEFKPELGRPKGDYGAPKGDIGPEFGGPKGGYGMPKGGELGPSFGGYGPRPISAKGDYGNPKGGNEYGVKKEIDAMDGYGKEYNKGSYGGDVQKGYGGPKEEEVKKEELYKEKTSSVLTTRLCNKIVDGLLGTFQSPFMSHMNAFKIPKLSPIRLGHWGNIKLYDGKLNHFGRIQRCSDFHIANKGNYIEMKGMIMVPEPKAQFCADASLYNRLKIRNRNLFLGAKEARFMVDLKVDKKHGRVEIDELEPKALSGFHIADGHNKDGSLVWPFTRINDRAIQQQKLQFMGTLQQELCNEFRNMVHKPDITKSIIDQV